MYITRIVLWELDCKLLSTYPENIRQMTLHWTFEKRLALEGPLLVLSAERQVDRVWCAPQNEGRYKQLHTERTGCLLAKPTLTAIDTLLGGPCGDGATQGVRLQ